MLDSDEESTAAKEEEGYHSSPLQLAAIQLRDLSQACEAANAVRVQKEVRGHDLTQRENAAVRLAAINPLSLLPLLPSSKWLGDVVMGASPINTATGTFSVQALQEGLHVLELFGGIGLGVLRTTLAAG